MGASSVCEDHNTVQVKLTIDLKHLNSSAIITTADSNFTNHHTVEQSLVICISNCSLSDTSNVSKFDSIVEDDGKPGLHFEKPNIKLKTALNKVTSVFVICFIVGVLALPIIFFYIRPGPDVNMTTSSSTSLVCICTLTCTNIHFCLHYRSRNSFWIVLHPIAYVHLTLEH